MCPKKKESKKMIFQDRYSEFKKCPLLPGKKCVGATCGGWRWHDPPEPELRIIEHSDPMAKVEPADRPADVPKSYRFWPSDGDGGACWIEPTENAIARRKGYCGFAGKMRWTE